MTFDSKLEKYDNKENEKIIRKFLIDEKLIKKDIKEVTYEMIEKRYCEFIEKYYYTRLEVAKTLCDFLSEEPEYEELKKIPIFKDTELRIELIRFLQGETPRKRSNIAEKFNVSEHTVDVAIAGRTDRSSNPISDFKFLGEKISIYLERGKNYYNSQTITPIFMGMSLGEIYAILKSLHSSSNDDISLLINEEICKKIYIQLSDYGKKIIRECLKQDGIDFKFCEDICERMKIDEEFSTPWLKKAADAKKLGNIHVETIDEKEYFGSLETLDQENLKINTDDAVISLKYDNIKRIY